MNYGTFECHAYPTPEVKITASVLYVVLWRYFTGRIATTLRAGRPLVRVQGGAKYLPSLQNVQTESVPMQCPIPWVSEHFVPELNRLMGEADHSTPISCRG